MIFRHTEAPYSEFVLLFHMALFFIASGFLYNDDRIHNLKDLISFIKRKLRGLWLPYFLYSSIFVLCNNLFLKFNIITDNPDFLVDYTGRYASLNSFMILVRW